jgi:hypothetical protein
VACSNEGDAISTIGEKKKHDYQRLGFLSNRPERLLELSEAQLQMDKIYYPDADL